MNNALPLFKNMRFLLLVAGVIGLNLVFWRSEPIYAESPQQIKNEQDWIRKSMVTISRQLGVSCTTCHRLDNFRDKALPNYKTAFEHLKIVQSLKDQGFNGKKGSGPLADCYMCHRGKLKPDFQEPINQLIEKELQTKTD